MLTVVGSALCIKSILYACGKSLNLCYYFVSNKTDQFKEVNILLSKTDIHRKIAKTHQFLREIDTANVNNSIKLAIGDLEECITNINNCLDQLIINNNNYQSLYFYRWRSYNIDDLLTQLNLNIDLFNIRFDDLLKIYHLSFLSKQLLSH